MNKVEGAAIEPLVSPIVANLYLGKFEREALHTASTPRHWYRFVDGTYVIQQESQKVKVKVLLLYSTARPDGFSSTLQPYPWQGTHPTLV